MSSVRIANNYIGGTLEVAVECVESRTVRLLLLFLEAAGGRRLHRGPDNVVLRSMTTFQVI